jgi:hypothetical protein
MAQITIDTIFRSNFSKIEDGIFITENKGYWSNLNKEDNEKLVALAEQEGARAAIQKMAPEFEQVIFSHKRAAGLELLDLKGAERVVDYGCMWGALTIPLAKRCREVIGVDQTFNSLQLLKARAQEEHLDNITLVCANMKTMPPLPLKADAAVINGVLEWIPDVTDIELKKFYGKFRKIAAQENPERQQITFLKKVRDGLVDDGKLYLAIENRFSYDQFLGFEDAHTNLRFVNVVPRFLANIISRLKVGRPFLNWIYSVWGLKRILRASGFQVEEVYAAFPDYRFPEKIFSLQQKDYRFTSSHKGPKLNFIENILFKRLKLYFLAPALIVIARKKA